MRKISIIFFIILCNSNILGQQSFSASFLKDIKGPHFQSRKSIISALKDSPYQKIRDSIREIRKSRKLNLPVFGLQGLGNLNFETLQSYNGSGKISFYVRPVQFRNNTITVFASYSQNASNNDSVLFQKLIFPEIGSSAFTGTVQLDKFWKKDDVTGHALSPFFEFSYKNIASNIESDSNSEDQKLHFTTLNYSLGIKYIFGLNRIENKDTMNLSFFAIPYLSFSNIPNEDTSDYRILLTRKVELNPRDGNLTDNITTAGFKIGFQFNGLQVFADFRSVLNKQEKVPIRELKGFHANIGFVFNTNALDYWKTEKNTETFITKYNRH